MPITGDCMEANTLRAVFLISMHSERYQRAAAPPLVAAACSNLAAQPCLPHPFDDLCAGWVRECALAAVAAAGEPAVDIWGDDDAWGCRSVGWGVERQPPGSQVEAACAAGAQQCALAPLPPGFRVPTFCGLGFHPLFVSRHQRFHGGSVQWLGLGGLSSLHAAYAGSG
jgi:hypothetical protein